MAHSAQSILRGWVDTRKNVQEILKSDEFLTSLVTRNADIKLIKEDSVNISGAVQIFCGARYLAHKLTQRGIDYIKSLVIGELMAHMLSSTMCLPTDAANKEFIFVCKFLLMNETPYNRGKTGQAWIASLNNLNAQLNEDERVVIPSLTDMSMDNYQHYLLWLAYTTPKAQYMSALQLLVTCYVGAAKRGTVSDRFIEKITNGIRDDIGEEITLDVDVIHTTYNNFGRYINADNAKDVFNRWLTDIPEHALRLRLTLEQVSGSGLTAFIISGRAIKKYATFPWSQLNKLTGGEMTNFMDAIRLVNGNPYFGLNRDLKAAKSTNYSTVAYVAKELLIQIAGESSLKNYQGWIKKPKSPVVIKQMIDDYVSQFNENLLSAIVGDSEVSEQNAILEIVDSESNINLFM